jgi:hypothetical protein
MISCHLPEVVSENATSRRPVIVLVNIYGIHWLNQHRIKSMIGSILDYEYL